MGNGKLINPQDWLDTQELQTSKLTIALKLFILFKRDQVQFKTQMSPFDAPFQIITLASVVPLQVKTKKEK